MKVYLAGPDVFLPNMKEIAQAKTEICHKYGFIGIFPFDTQIDLNSLKPYQAGLAIYQSNVKLMDSCDLIVANMTPFRSPSMDVGTAFEIGYMTAKGKPVFGYTNDGRLYLERVTQNASTLDEKGMNIESFEMRDNLMLEGAILSSGGILVGHSHIATEYYTDLSVFETVIQIAAQKLLINPDKLG